MILSATTDVSPIPISTPQDLCDPNYKLSMDNVMCSTNIFGCRWLYDYKFNSHGKLDQY